MNNNENQSNIQIEKKQKMSPEELEKTHVLNLDAVHDAIRYEKMTSKKPAIIVAVIGLIAILSGVFYQAYNSYSQKKAEQRKIEQRRQENKKVPLISTEFMNCKLSSQLNPDGTNYLMEINYGFTNQKLSEFTKKFTVVQTPGVELGANTIASYINAYKLFMNPIDGYQISVTPTTNVGVVVIVKVDYKELDLTRLNPRQATHFSTSVDYFKNTEQEKIKEDMISKGYTCQ